MRGPSRSHPPVPSVASLQPSLLERFVSGVADHQQHEDRTRPEPAGREQQRPQRVRVDEVGVVDDDDRGGLAATAGHELEQLHAHADVLAAAEHIRSRSSGARI